MEVMREQSPKGGVIQQVTSIGGQRGVPTFRWVISFPPSGVKRKKWLTSWL